MNVLFWRYFTVVFLRKKKSQPYYSSQTLSLGNQPSVMSQKVLPSLQFSRLVVFHTSKRIAKNLLSSSLGFSWDFLIIVSSRWLRRVQHEVRHCSKAIHQKEIQFCFLAHKHICMHLTLGTRVAGMWSDQGERATISRGLAVVFCFLAAVVLCSLFITSAQRQVCVCHAVCFVRAPFLIELDLFLAFRLHRLKV